MLARPSHALYSDAPGRHGLCIFHRKGRAIRRRAGKRGRYVARMLRTIALLPV